MGTLTLLDGHNRYEICTRLELPFDIEEVRFADRSHAEEWIIRNQFGRRNLSAYVRTQLALRLEDTIKRRSQQGKRNDLSPISGKSVEGLDTHREVAKVASVGHDTVASELGVSRATVQRGGDYAAAIDRLTSLLGVERDDLRESEFIREGETGKGRKLRIADVIELGKKPGTYDTGKKARATVTTESSLPSKRDRRGRFMQLGQGRCPRAAKREGRSQRQDGQGRAGRGQVGRFRGDRQGERGAAGGVEV